MNRFRMFLLSIIVIIVAFGLSATTAHAARHQVYAPPIKYGVWRTVASHAGSVTYTIKVKPIGKTKVFGQVRYYNKANKRVTTSFYDKIVIVTGNAYANVDVRLKGVPTGSSCYVDVSP